MTFRDSKKILRNSQNIRAYYMLNRRVGCNYFFLSSWAGGILQILQSDWFRERAVFSPSGPLTAGGSFRNHLLGFRKK